MDSVGRTISVRSGREWSDWSAELRISGDELMWKFYSDGSVNGWGWRFTVYPIMPKSTAIELLSDRAILSKPSVEPVRCIISQRVGCYAEKKLVSRLASALAACAELSSLGKFFLPMPFNFTVIFVSHFSYIKTPLLLNTKFCCSRGLIPKNFRNVSEDVGFAMFALFNHCHRSSTERHQL